MREKRAKAGESGCLGMRIGECKCLRLPGRALIGAGVEAVEEAAGRRQ